MSMSDHATFGAGSFCNDYIPLVSTLSAGRACGPIEETDIRGTVFFSYWIIPKSCGFK